MRGFEFRAVFLQWANFGKLSSHHAEGLVNPNKHVDSENIKFKIGRRSSVYQLLKKLNFYFIKCG
jgi:hypothetical protein